MKTTNTTKTTNTVYYVEACGYAQLTTDVEKLKAKWQKEYPCLTDESIEVTEIKYATVEQLVKKLNKKLDELCGGEFDEDQLEELY